MQLERTDSLRNFRQCQNVPAGSSFRDGIRKVGVYGDQGMVHIGQYNKRWGYKVFDKAGKMILHDEEKEPEQHQKNFAECVRSRKLPNADIAIGHLSVVHCHLANIVARAGHNVRFNQETESIVDDPAANLYVKRTYRTHWSTPKVL